MEEGEREIIYTSLHCHHQDSCIKMGSDESHFNVSVGSDGQNHKTVSTNHNLGRKRRAEAVSNRGPSAYQPNALPLGQTGSRLAKWSVPAFVSCVGMGLDLEEYGQVVRAIGTGLRSRCGFQYRIGLVGLTLPPWPLQTRSIPMRNPAYIKLYLSHQNCLFRKCTS